MTAPPWLPWTTAVGAVAGVVLSCGMVLAKLSTLTDEVRELRAQVRVLETTGARHDARLEAFASRIDRIERGQ